MHNTQNLSHAGKSDLRAAVLAVFVIAGLSALPTASMGQQSLLPEPPSTINDAASPSPATATSASVLAAPVDTGPSSGGPSTLMAQISYPPFRFDPSLNAQLSPTVTAILDNCQVHLPVGYTPRALPASMQLAPQIKMQLFAGPAHADTSVPIFTVFAASVPPSKYDVNAILHGALLGDIRKNSQEWQNMTYAPPTFGMINGIPFSRVYYKGVGPTPSGAALPQRGFTYACFDAQHSVVIVIRANDSQAYGAATMPIAEAAVMTFTPR